MPDRHGVTADHEQPGPFRLRDRVRRDAEGGSGSLYGREPAGVVGDRDQHQRLRRRGEPAGPVEEDPFDPGGEHQLRGQRSGPSELRVTEAGRELDERERVPAGLGEQPVGDLGRDHDRSVLGEQRPHRGGVQPVQPQGRHPVGGERAVVGVAGREHHRNRVRVQASGREQQRVGRGGVEPVCVVDDAHHRLLLGRLGEHRQGRDRHQERLDRPHLLPERDPERARLRLR